MWALSEVIHSPGWQALHKGISRVFGSGLQWAFAPPAIQLSRIAFLSLVHLYLLFSPGSQGIFGGAHGRVTLTLVRKQQNTDNSACSFWPLSQLEVQVPAAARAGT